MKTLFAMIAVLVSSIAFATIKQATGSHSELPSTQSQPTARH